MGIFLHSNEKIVQRRNKCGKTQRGEIRVGSFRVQRGTFASDTFIQRGNDVQIRRATKNEKPLGFRERWLQKSETSEISEPFGSTFL